MKSVYQSVIVAFLLLTCLNPLLAQWVQTNGPYGGTVNCFVTSGPNVYAGTNGGLFLSTNNGTEWTNVSGGLNGLAVSALAIDSNGTGGVNLIAAAFNFTTCMGEIALSTDGGTSWAKTADSIRCLDEKVYHSFVVTPNGKGGTNVFFGGSFDPAVYLSTDHGANWSVDSGYPFLSVCALAAGPNGAGGIDIFSAQVGISLSTDNGTSWKWVADSGLRGSIVSLLAFPDGVGGTNLLAGTQQPGGVFLSTNNGNSWKEVDSGLPSDTSIFTVTALATGPSGTGGTNIFAGTDRYGIFLSTNNGASWSAVRSGMTDSTIFAITISGTSIFAGTNSGGVFISTDNGTSWTAVNQGLMASGIDKLVAVSSGKRTNTFAGTSSQIFLSTNSGASWRGISSGLPAPSVSLDLPFSSVNALAASGPNIFAGTSSGIFLSTNDGATWESRDTGLVSPFATALAVNGANIFAGGDVITKVVDHKPVSSPGMYLSTNSGASWSIIDSGLAGGLVLGFAVDSSGAGGPALYALTGLYETYLANCGVYRSTNAGTTWTYLGIDIENPVFGTPVGPVQALGIVSNGRGGTNLIAGSFDWALGSVFYSGVYLSTDTGKNWTTVKLGGGNTVPVVKSFAAVGTNIFAGTDQGVFLSTNSGLNWTSVNSGLGELNVQSLLIINGSLFAGTSGGVWRRPLSEFPLGVEDKNGQLPSAFRLFQNYPNPFNPSTVINYQLPTNSFVTLKVYDVLGREVEALVNEHQNTGFHSVTFNAANFPSGVYFYRLQAGTFTETKKLTVLK